jgi:GNAT superfamily N-acetyltransferase
VLRRAAPDDAYAIAAVFTAARAAQAEVIPDLHTPDEHRWFVRERMLPTQEVWVAEDDGEIVGFAAINEDLLGHIYVHPSVQGRGFGKALLEKTKERRPDGFTLWTHQPNDGARRFYEREGLVAVEFTDGATNEERMPDVRYAWQPASRESTGR